MVQFDPITPKDCEIFAVFLVLERILNSSCRQEVAAVATYSGNTTETRERLVRRAGYSVYAAK